MRTQFSIQPLIDLGLTVLESEIYAYLVQNSPATGYRVAKDIGKPTANTYKAIGSLQDKGFIIVEDSTNRLCRAVPTEEFLDVLERRFVQLKKQAKRELVKLKPAPDDERLYYLKTPEQVFERLRQMLKKCEGIALLDLFPMPLEEIRSAIESAASRGVRVAVKVYRTCTIRGAEVVVYQKGERTIERWPGQWANGVVDGQEHLLALLSRDGEGILQAVWSTNTYTSWVYHSSLMFELLHGVLAERLGEEDSILSVPGQYKRLEALNAEEATGYRILTERFSEKEWRDEIL
jgi:sugar-specific transcriptional regulator TrmB